MDFMRAGGVPIWIVLFFGLAALVTGIVFAIRPDERKAAVLRALSTTTVFSILSGVTSDIASVMFKVPRHPEWSHSPDRTLIIMTGLGESMTPAILGFTLLALVWLLAAVGSRRAPQLS